MESVTVRIRSTRVERWDSVPDLGEAWNDLLNRSPEYSVFQTFPWHACWWKAFGAPHELLLILAYADRRLVGIAPMMITREERPFGRVRTYVCFIGSMDHASDYCDFIVDPNTPDALGVLLAEVCKYSKQAHRINLTHFPSHSQNQPKVIEYFKTHAFRVMVDPEAEAPVRIMGNTDEDKKVANKTSLNNCTNYFKKTGELKFLQCKSEAEVTGYLDNFFEQHERRWMQVGLASQFHQSGQRAFYKDLIRSLLPYGWLRFDVLIFNESPLAFHFGFEYRNRVFYYKPTFDVKYASKSPGSVLLKFLLDDAIKRGLEEFDFTVGSEPYKYRYANRTRTNFRLIVFQSITDFLTWQGRMLLTKCLNRVRLLTGTGVSLQPIPALEKSSLEVPHDVNQSRG